MIACIFVFVWLRGTLPRLRYDQFMAMGWKIIIPVNLVWILAVTAIHVLRDRGWSALAATALPLGIVLLVIVVPALMIYEGASARKAADDAADDEDEAALEPTFPTPPLDLQSRPPPRQLASAGARRREAELEPGSTEGDADDE